MIAPPMSARLAPSAVVALCSVAVLLAMPTSLSAQCDPLSGGEAPLVPPPPCAIVSVTPDGIPGQDRVEFSTGHSETFWVQNIGGAAGSFSLSCWGTNGITCTGTNPSTVSLAAGEQKPVTVNYSVGAPGSAQLWLRATGETEDTGYRIIAVIALPPPVIALRHDNNDNRDRSLCLTSGAGEAAAWQCGDLLVSHSMPGYMTMGRERSITLLYSSAQATPRPVVVASVTQISGSTPNSVVAELKVDGALLASASYTAWGTAPLVRQIALSYDASGDATGIYPFDLIVTNQYTSSSKADTASGELLVVNRSSSEFGGGWWLAGVEQLVLGQSGSRILWVGGDGSAKVYTSVGANTWAGAPGAYRDTLRYDFGTLTYTRTLRHGIQVKYNASGRHIETVNRVGQRTRFFWNTTTGRLDSIAVPPQNSDGTNMPGTVYRLTYDANGKLDRMTDPAGRVLDATVSSGRLSTLTDPDNYSTGFGYDAAGRITQRTTRRNHTTHFTYAKGLRVTRVSVPLDPSRADSAITLFEPWDEKGLATGPTGQTAVDTAQGFTKMLGPRVNVADDASFWVDRWGAPLTIRDPLGFETRLRRGDAANPALVTRVQSAVGRVLGIGYNARGNLTFMADSTYEGTGTMQTVTTSYLYGDIAVPDLPTEVRTPVDTARFWHNGSLGLPDTVLAQGGHRTRFEYFTSGHRKGRVQRITELGVAVVDTTSWTKSTTNLATVLDYDSWGNDSIATSPKGGRTTWTRDSYRRVRSVTDPAGHRTDLTYDVLNNLRSQTAYDPGALTTQYFIDSATAALDSVLDPRQVKRAWEFDAAARPVRLKDEAQSAEQRFINPAGLVDSVLTRNLEMIRHRYDAGGQLTTTSYPQRIYPEYCNIECFGPDAIPGDSLVRTYDPVGRLLTVTRSSSTITRTYNREGTLRSERQVLRNSAGTVVSDVTLQSWYDVGGRRTKFYNGTDTLRYNYGVDARLSRLTVEWATGQAPDTFRFYWDGLGRRDSLVYSMGAFVSFGYDGDGHLRMACARHSSISYADDYLDHRLWYQALTADGIVSEVRRWAGGTDSPSCGGIGSAADSVEHGSYEYDARHQIIKDARYQYDYDGSGNRVAKRWKSDGSLVDSLFYAARRNRIYREFTDTRQLFKTYIYEADGALYNEFSVSGGADRRYYHNALGEMTGHRWVSGWAYDPEWDRLYPVWSGSPTLCKYDALGRRVNACGSGGGGWLAFDGDNAVRAGTYTTWRYVQGPGLDDPLVGMYAVNPGEEYRKHYYLTDGRGRHLAFTDSLGTNYMGDPTYYQNGGNQAGSIENSHGFDNARQASANMPQLSFYRNRYYDQRTGRFLQEDPIDIAGGVNLYQFAGNNPVAYTDPFGLCPWCAVAYAIFEIGSTLYDVGDLAITGIRYATGRASGLEFAVTAGGAGLGLIAFGGGYGAAARGLVKSLDDLSTAARVADRGGLTRAGRALTKHARGRRAGSQLFPELSGTVDDINRAAGEIVDDILTNPQSTASTITRGRFKGGVEIYDPSGRGLVYDSQGNFITFVER